MDTMPIHIVILGSIPEAILIVWAGLNLMGVRPDRKKVVFIGILQGISSYFIRRHLDFGPHIIAQVILLILYTYLIIRVKWVTAIAAISLSFVIVILVEGSLIILGGMNTVHILSMEWKRLLVLLPHDFVLGYIGYVSSKKDICLWDEVNLSHFREE
ncbi:hypothetical protein QBE52_03305 [Clostridiaceae bacterium 35-E11]